MSKFELSEMYVDLNMHHEVSTHPKVGVSTY